jgi:hypothetical protein
MLGFGVFVGYGFALLVVAVFYFAIARGGRRW